MFLNKNIARITHIAKMVVALVGILTAIVILSIVRSVEASEFNNRSLMVDTPEAGQITQYAFTFGYTAPGAVGSLRFEFCTTPLPMEACTIPAGFDAQTAVFSSQSGETGYSLFSQSQNTIILSRPPQAPGAGLSTYVFDNIVNPVSENQTVYVRLNSFSTTDATGPFLDEGAVATSTTPSVDVYTQVPPVLIFCVATTINDAECSDMTGNYTNVGELRPTQTAAFAIQMQARTNARSGYSIQMAGNSMASGINIIPPLNAPTPSLIGVGQFGMNLAANTNPAVGASPVGPGINAIINPDYSSVNQFKYANGDVLVTSANPTRNRKFTISHIINVPESQPLGVYTTTITYVCIGSF